MARPEVEWVSDNLVYVSTKLGRYEIRYEKGFVSVTGPNVRFRHPLAGDKFRCFAEGAIRELLLYAAGCVISGPVFCLLVLTPLLITMLTVIALQCMTR